MATKTHETQWLYAQTVNEQVNPNLIKQNHWSSMANAVGDKSTFANAKYTRTGKKGAYKYTTPYVITAHDFRITEDIIPSNAYITKVTIECKFKAEKGINVKAPVAHFMIYRGTGTVKQATKGKTGWYNDTYRVYPSKKIGTSETTVEYTISGTEWNKIKYPTKQLYNTVMGIDLHFQDPSSMTGSSKSIYMKWARIKVYYEVFDPYLIWTPNSVDGDNPLECVVEDTVKVCGEFGNRSHVNGGTQELTVQIPFGLELVSNTCNNCSFTLIDEYEQLYKWVCTGSALAKNTLCLTLKAKSMGLKRVTAQLNDILFEGEYLYVNDYENIEYTDAVITIPDGTECKSMCFHFRAKLLDFDDTVKFVINTDYQNKTNHNLISSNVKEAYNNSNNGNYLIKWELSQESQANGISIESYNNNFIEFAIDRDIVGVNETVEIKWTGCFVPMFSGSNTIALFEDGNPVVLKEYNVNSNDGIILLRDNAKWEDLFWNEHRIASELETDGYILNCGLADFENVMYQGDCTLRAYYQKEIAYIGCVPVQRSHYEPEHNSENDGISEQFKNKTYKGKTGEFKEDTSLKIMLPPKDWTTLRGLVKIDKPIPVNLVPDAFEGDVLNHRGWAEITKIHNVRKTNPLWYDGEIDLDYLTHNINTRFEIVKGNKICKTELPNLLAPVIDSGEEFANYTYINVDGEEVTNGSGYFDVNTDGSYVYDAEAEETQRTLISIDNGQYATIKSSKLLTEQSQISMEWNSTKILENRENNIQRIISITDSDGKTIFEYEYTNFEWIEDDEYYTCDVIYRVLEGENWSNPKLETINLAVDIESLQLYRNNKGELVQESEPNEDALTDDAEDEDLTPYIYNDFMYGSTVHFTFNNNKLTIVDEGYNGKELSATVELPEGSYRYNVEWKNKNTDAETNEVITFFDFEVMESILVSDLTGQYSNMRVSSFPLANQSLLFTRQSEEGMLYYWKDSSNPYTYIQEPFYMYFCGVDLTNQKGSSIFELDNSYSIFYLTNGLVRCGFNRLNGEVYISKYDIYSRQYLNVAQLQLTNFTDFERGTYSDDKIEIKAGTTVFTMYRGHPYIIVNHKDEDLLFANVWNQVWAETTNNDDPLDFPSFWSLINDSNMLSSDIRGLNLSKSNIVFDEYENDVDNPQLTLTQNTNSYVEEDTIFSVDGTINTIDETIPLLTDYHGSIGDYQSYVETDSSIVCDVRLHRSKGIVVKNEKCVLTAGVDDFDGEGINGKSVDFVISHNDSVVSTLTGVTNSGGVASVEYIGTGDNGKMNIKAVCDGFVSETYDIYDVLFKDTQTSDFISQYGVLNSNNDGSWSFTTNQYSYAFLWCNLKGTSTNSNIGDYTGDLCYEVYITQVTDTHIVVYETYSSTSKSIRFNGGVGLNTVVIKDRQIRYYLNGVLKDTRTNNLSEPYRLGLILYNNTSVTFKDVKIYPITSNEEGGVVEYLETVPAGALGQGQLNYRPDSYSQISISDEWSSIGNYSIKSTFNNPSWAEYRIYNPSINKKGTCSFDTKLIGRCRFSVILTIDSTERTVFVDKTDFEGTIVLNYDFTEYTGDVRYFKLRVTQNWQSDATVYMDNIHIY